MGLDNIDCKACRERGIAVIPARSENNTAVAEYVLAGLLMLARGCFAEHSLSPPGHGPGNVWWAARYPARCSVLSDSEGIARDVALRARACGMRVMAYDPFLPADAPDWEKLGVEPVMLETLLAEADAVSLHVPLTPDTRQLFDAGRLARMKPGAVLINTARGGIVEEAALADALRSGRLAGAMVDVFEKEPLPAGSPLADVPNCLLTPHIAGVTRESNVRVSAVVARKVAECLRGAACILTPEQLQDLGMAVFREAGVPEEAAASVVEALVRAELDGLPSHGFSRIPFYVDQALSGKVKARAIPLVRQAAPAAVLVDAGNGFAFPAILAGLEKAIPLARGNGVSVLGVTRSHHCGVVGLYAERIAEAGLISLIFSNTPAAMAPWNGSKASFGTNPLAFGCPREGKHPLVIDMSLSKVARGKIMGAKQRGEAIPEGWALDAAGRATTDPVAALGGTMIPVGDAKGAALALMVEILSATLTGANHAYEASSFFEPTGSAPGIGQTFILLDPKPLNPDFSARLEALCGHLLGQEGVRLPGERRFTLRERNRISGVNLPEALYNDLRKRAGVA